MLSEKLLQTDSGNSVIIAMDHGLTGRAYEGFKNPKATLDKVLKGDPDGVIVGPFFLLQFKEKLMAKPNLKKVVSVDFISGSTLPGEDEKLEIQNQLFSVKEMTRIGADAIKALLIFGREDPAVFVNNIKYVAQTAEKARQFNIPFVIEPTLWGERIENKGDPELIQHITRMAFELGADIIKCPYTGDEETFKSIVQNSPLPILILGGPKVNTDKELLEMVSGAMGAGARGVFFGRNVWQHQNPTGMVEALKKIVHENASVDEALDML